jgi:hypothetical protein
VWRNCLRIVVVRMFGICTAASKLGVALDTHWNRGERHTMIKTPSEASIVSFAPPVSPDRRRPTRRSLLLATLGLPIHTAV